MEKERNVLAHRSEDGRQQTILEHLTGTAKRSVTFAKAFHGEQQAELVGLAHDIGKYSEAFQRRIRGGKESVDHSSAGMVECWKRRQLTAAFAVAGHHGGLPDLGSRTDALDKGTLLARLERAKQIGLDPYERWQQEVCLPEATLPQWTQNDQKAWMFYTRMMYSCLVDGDFLDTEAFMEGAERTDTATSMETLWERLQAYTAQWEPAKGTLNQQRTLLLQQCKRTGSEYPSGLYTLTVPTGGGKTVASLAFALSHARTHHKDRVIYIVPYTSIIEQTAQVFRDILGKESVLEHHSGMLYDLEQMADPVDYRMAQATENWDYPVIVTTAVQFFESLYHNRSSRCRKLHNIANSVLVFDEAQMLPLAYLRPCVYAIAQLVAHYETTAVLCTATQPALDKLFAEFLPGQTIVELCPTELQDAEVFRRVSFHRQGRTTWEALCQQMEEHQQVLCIVNTRKSAQKLYEMLPPEGAFCLTTLLYPAHRQRIYREIKQRLLDGLPCRVVSTSLIEAGVDLDFPAVYREVAGLDSILQAAGRCNREGKRTAAESVVTVFQSEAPLPDGFSRAAAAAQVVMEAQEDLASRNAIRCYFEEWLDLSGKEAQDQQEILPLMEGKTLPFATIAERFHLIDSQGRTIYIPLEEGEELVEQLRAKQYTRDLYRRLGRYGVTVYEGQFQSLYRAGAVEILEDGSVVLLNTALYRQDTGLQNAAQSVEDWIL